jgi:hypothetical protein
VGGSDRETIALAGERRKRVIGPENISGAIDKIEMVAAFDDASLSKLGGGPNATRLRGQHSQLLS